MIPGFLTGLTVLTRATAADADIVSESQASSLALIALSVI